MSVFHNNALIGSGGGAVAADFQIDRSLRFSRADSANLSRTPSSESNRRTWTWSAWVKRSDLTNSLQGLFGAGVDDYDYTGLYFQGDELKLEDYPGGGIVRTQPVVLRDPSAWYHIVIAVDTTQSTAADRVKFYLNGVQLTTSGTWAQNTQTRFNKTQVHKLGKFYPSGGSNEHFTGYLAEVNFVDGQQLAPTDFGEYDSNNVWQPKEYSGTYGTNGFRLTFADNSSNSALGTDTSGNSNTFTVNSLTAKSPGDYDAPQNFGVVTYTGNGTTNTAISGLAFQPDFVWIKARSQAYDHMLFDSIRGTGKNLRSNLSDAEGTNANDLQSFDSNGFTVGYGGYVNGNNVTFTAWCWKAGGTAVSNTDGTITSSVSANPDYGFSIVSYSGSGSSGTIGHGLSSAPKIIIVKPRTGTTTYGWRVYSSVTGNANHLRLDTNTAESAYSDWNSTDPTSSVFSVDGSPAGTVNASGSTYIAYCFADVPGYQKIGTVNGSGSDQTITTGFCPQYVFFKATNAAEAWLCIDRTRDPSKSSAATKFLEFDNSNAEVSNVNRIEWLADGFKVVSDGTRIPNVSGTEYLYLAIAGVPSGEEDDSLLDTPTNYEADSGNAGGNYATLNPLNKGSQITLSNGNLDWAASSTSTAWQTRYGFSTIGVTSGKWYAEATITDIGSNQVYVGVVGDPVAPYSNTSLGYQAHGWGYYSQGNIFWQGGTYQAASTGTFTTGDVIGVALDLDNLTIKFYKNGSLAGTRTGLTAGKTYFFGADSFSNCSQSWNFGQRPFAYTAPSSHLAVCTQNLSDPTIADGSTAFDALLYTGDGTSSRNLTLPLAADLVWIKKRSATGSHHLADTVRGDDAVLLSNSTNAEANPQTGFVGGGISSISNTTVTLSEGTSNNDNMNANNATFVGWLWDAGANSSKTYTVKVVSDSGNKYRFDDFGTSAVTLDLEEGSTYVFDQSDSSNSGHPLRFSTTSDGTHGSGSEYTTGVTTTGTPGSAGAKTTIVVAASAPTLYYYCTNHSGMGGQANTNSTAGASNFDGSIQSTVRANQSAGFSIVTYTDPTNVQTVGHGLNAAPEFIIVKSRTGTTVWLTYHKSLGKDYYTRLEDTDASYNVSNIWGTAEPTSSVFGTDGDNQSNMVAYCWTSVDQFSSFGSYEGNGSSDGPFVHTGFRPAWVLYRNADAAAGWQIYDSTRDSFNQCDARLQANSNGAEDTQAAIDILSNGFKQRATHARSNASGNTYIYAAFAEHPLKTTRAR